MRLSGCSTTMQVKWSSRRNRLTNGSAGFCSYEVASELCLLSRRQVGYCGVMAADIRDVDPAELRLPSSRSSGADPGKLKRQIAKHGRSTAGMPLLVAYEGSDGALELYDGVTRATRVAKLLPANDGES